MGVREKLVELLDNFRRDLSPFAGNEKLFVVDDNIEQAEYLIANGVTVEEWIPVTERLPEINIGVLVYTPRLKNTFETFYKGDGKWQIVSYRNCEILNDEVTHWMSLPEPPKGD